MQSTSRTRYFPLATALRETFRDGYRLKDFREDAMAGLIVSLIALPLAMALSIAVGLPPQHGLYTAIIAGVAAAILGGSRTQVSGPTAAFVVIVAPIVAEHGLRGIIWCQILAGVMLIALGLTRMGRIINYIPYPVTTGFTAGIAVVIATIALNDFLGLGLPGGAGHWLDKVSAIAQHIGQVNLPALALGMGALLIMVYMPKITARMPGSIVGIVFATLGAWWLERHGLHIPTIGSNFSFTDASGAIIAGVPPTPPQFHVPGLSADSLFALPTVDELRVWLTPALIIAALGGLESLLSATVADSMAGTKHDPDAELTGIGVANILSGCVSGIPATGAIARTAANINNGGRSPFSSIIHALLILIYMMVLAPLIAYVPMTALSALLIVTAWRMSHAKHFLRLARDGHKDDVIVLIACFAMTVLIDMVAGVTVGVVAATILFLRRTVRTSGVSRVESGAEDIQLPDHVMLFRFDGPLFFGTAQSAMEEFSLLKTEPKTVILDLLRVPHIDATGLEALEHLVHSLQRDGHRLIICRGDNKQGRKIDALPNTQVAYATSLEEALKSVR